MSDPTTNPTDGQAAQQTEAAAEVQAEVKIEASPEASDAKPADTPPNVTAEASTTFEDVKKKLSEQLSDLGSHVEGLSQKLTEAAGHARQLIEKELQTLKTQHPEAFAKLEELRHSGDESLDVLRGRLDKLAGDLEKAVSGFVHTLADQAKKATKGADQAPAATTQSDTTQAPQAAQSAPPQATQSETAPPEVKPQS